MPIEQKRVQGDASETGVVKYVQPILDLEDARSMYPVHSYIDGATRA